MAIKDEQVRIYKKDCELSRQQVAQMLGISEQAVSDAEHSAMRKIRGLIRWYRINPKDLLSDMGGE